MIRTIHSIRTISKSITRSVTIYWNSSRRK